MIGWIRLLIGTLWHMKMIFRIRVKIYSVNQIVKEINSNNSNKGTEGLKIDQFSMTAFDPKRPVTKWRLLVSL